MDVIKCLTALINIYIYIYMFQSFIQSTNTFTSQADVTMQSQHHIAALILIFSFTMFYKHDLFILNIAFFLIFAK